MLTVLLGGSMVARLKLKDIDGRAPPGGFTPGKQAIKLSRLFGEAFDLRGLSLSTVQVPAATVVVHRSSGGRRPASAAGCS